MEPGSGLAYFRLGMILNYAGRYGEAIPMLKNALRPMPIPLTHLLGKPGLFVSNAWPI